MGELFPFGYKGGFMSLLKIRMAVEVDNCGGVKRDEITIHLPFEQSYPPNAKDWVIAMAAQIAKKL